MASPDPVIKDLDELRNKARAARRRLEPGWFLDWAFFNNQQWLAWAGDRLHQPDMGSDRMTITENRVTGCVRTELAKMTKNRPMFTVTPNTGDEEDTNAAELAERVMRYMWRHLNMPQLHLKALEWSRVCSAGFLKTYWDSSTGPAVDLILDPNGQPVPDQTGRAMRGDKQMAAQLSEQFGVPLKSKRVAQGDVKVEVRSPFQMFVDPICDTFEEAEWVIEESIKSASYVETRYGAKIKPDTPANPGLIDGRLMGGAIGQSAGAYMGVRVREYWCKPCVKYPNGCKITWCPGKQGQVLDRDDKPFDPLPYVMFTGVPVPGRLFGMSSVELLRGPQTELNKAVSQMRENANRIGNPTVLASKQSILDPDKFLDSMSAPGGTYFFDETGSQHPLPQYLETPQLPEYVAVEPERVAKVMEDISGQHEVTNANVPPGVTAASAITLLQEADDTRLGLAMQDNEEQIGRFGRKVLELVANYYTDQRTLRIGGDDAAWEMFDFKGAMLKGNTHVDVEAGSSFPQSKAAKQAQLIDWLRMMAQMGHALDPRQISQWLRDVGLGATDRLVSEYSSNEQQANRENNIMVQTGQPLPINPQDDDEAHVANHEDFEKQARFFQLPPEIQQAHQQHVLEHRKRLQQQQQIQLEQQLAMAGKVPPNLSQAAFQDEQQLSQLQGLGQMQMDMAQGQQQQQGQAQQQGFDQAGAEQKQRQAEAEHQQQMHHRDAKHQQEQQHAAEMHQARVQAVIQQAQQAQRQQRGGQGARSNQGQGR